MLDFIGLYRLVGNRMAYRGSTKISCATVTVLNLGQEFIGPSDQKGMLINIPERGTILVMKWDPARQRPVVVYAKKIRAGSK